MSNESGENLTSSINISFANSELFDQYLAENKKCGLPECADLHIVTKEGGMQSGKSMAMITFTVFDEILGEKRRVQAPISLASLAMLASACNARMEFEEAHSVNGRNVN